MNNNNHKKTTTTTTTNLTSTEKILFELIGKKRDNNGFMNERNVPGLKKFFERRLSSQLFNINCHNENGCTPLMIAAWELCDESEYIPVSEDDERRAMEVIMILLENGAEINSQNTERGGLYCGQAALHIACSYSTSNIVSLLLCHGANPNLPDVNGITPLLIAIRCANYDIMKVLLEYGADMNFKTNRGDAAMHEICFTDHFYSYSITVRTGRCYNYKNQDVALVVKLLLEYGVDVNIQNEYGATLIFLAVKKVGGERTLVAIKLLLGANADVNISLTKSRNDVHSGNLAGDTPLHAAVSFCQSEVVPLLLGCHPNLGLRNSDNKTVLDIAREHCISPKMINFINEELRYQMYKYLLRRWATKKKLQLLPIK